MSYAVGENFIAQGRIIGVVEKVATILHEGWELDNHAYLVRLDNGAAQLWTTSHGSACQTDLMDVLEHIHEATAALVSLQQLMDSYMREQVK